jgi:hypothetical protein
MSFLNVSRPAYCQRLENFTRSALLRIGLDGQGLEPNAAEVLLGLTAGEIASQALNLALDGYVEFEYQVSESTNGTDVINLTTQVAGPPRVGGGVNTTLADGMRKVEYSLQSSDDANYRNFERRFYIKHDTLAVSIVPGSVLLQDALTTVDATSGNFGTAGAETLVPSVSSTDVILTYTGQSGDATLATIKVRIFPLELQSNV